MDNAVANSQHASPAQADPAPPDRGAYGSWAAVTHAVLVSVLTMLGVCAIPLTAWAVGPIYAEFGLALPATTGAILRVTPLGLVVIAGVLAAVASASRNLVRGRAAAVVFGLGTLVSAAGGLLILAMLLLPLMRMTESLAS